MDEFRFSLFQELPRVIIGIPGATSTVTLDVLGLNNLAYDAEKQYDATHPGEASDDRTRAKHIYVNDVVRRHLAEKMQCQPDLLGDFAITELLNHIYEKTSEFLRERNRLDDEKKTSSPTASLPQTTQEYPATTGNGMIDSNSPGSEISVP